MEPFVDSLIKELPEAVESEYPPKRYINPDESRKLKIHFKEFLHSAYVDGFNRIMLRIHTNESTSIYYIEPEDLELLD